MHIIIIIIIFILIIIIINNVAFILCHKMQKKTKWCTSQTTVDPELNRYVFNRPLNPDSNNESA